MIFKFKCKSWAFWPLFLNFSGKTVCIPLYKTVLMLPTSSRGLHYNESHPCYTCSDFIYRCNDPPGLRNRKTEQACWTLRQGRDVTLCWAETSARGHGNSLIGWGWGSSRGKVLEVMNNEPSLDRSQHRSDNWMSSCISIWMWTEISPSGGRVRTRDSCLCKIMGCPLTGCILRTPLY